MAGNHDTTRIRRLLDRRARIGRSVRLMEAALDRTVPLAELAEAACLSPYHHLRTYAALTGETPLVTHRRLRLKSAARLIGEHGHSVTDAAFATGFESFEGFTRAFGRQFGMTPSACRERRLGSVRIPPQIVDQERRFIFSNQTPFDVPDEAYVRLLTGHGPTLKTAKRAEIVTLGKEPGLGAVSDWSTHVFAITVDPSAGARSPHRTLEGGAFLRLPFLGDPADCPGIADREARDLSADGHVATDGRWIKRFHNDPAITPTCEVRWDLYLPTRPRAVKIRSPP